MSSVYSVRTWYYTAILELVLWADFISAHIFCIQQEMKQKITDIQLHLQDPLLLKICLDEIQQVVVPTKLVNNLGLRIGLEIEAEVIEKLIVAEETMRAKKFALEMLQEEVYSKSQMSRHLEKEGFSDVTIESIVTELIQSGHIRDRQFAEKWVKRRLKSNPRARKLLKMELIEKGVDRKTVEQVLNEVNENDEERLALQIARKQAKKYKHLSNEVAHRRLHGYLARRGYDTDLIMKIIHRVF